MTDYLPACQEMGGGILNVTINKYLHGSLNPRQDQRIILHAPDHDDLTVEIEDASHLDGRGPLGLVQEALRRFELPSGVEMTTYSEMPGGAGLGSSSTLATCVIAILDAYTGRRLSNYEIAELARDLETCALQATYGWQDQYSPVTGGGVKYMRYWPGRSAGAVEVDLLRLPVGTLAALEKSLVVCYTGLSRPAKQILDAVASGFHQGESGVREAFRQMNDLADEMRGVLLRGDLTGMGELLTAVWTAHKRLHPAVTNEVLESFFEAAQHAGALGGRVCGAGGGGTMMFWCDRDKDYAVKRRLRELGGTIFDWSVDREGLLIWE
jgi:D-glycero-alpha-D-manno-heptose-7-phosphate kinase